MKKHDADLFFADYLDYSIEKQGRDILFPFEQLTFDLLCFYPDSIALTLTSTLIGESSKHFVEFHDFWTSGALKIHLSKGDTADKYLSRKLASTGSITDNNYEINLYSSDGADAFINKYLKTELLGNNINYVLPRISNADLNNRQAVLDSLVENERAIIENPRFPMTLREFDRLALQLDKLASDPSFTFQRSYIIRNLVKHKIYKDSSSIPPFFLSMLDTSYNRAMAQSINAITISTMNKQLNGAGLRNFIRGYSPNLYNLIRSMTPTQTYLLAQDKNWQIFRGYIFKLYKSLSSNQIITQDTPLYKKTIKHETKNNLVTFCLDEMANVVFDAIKYASPWVYSDVENAKLLASNYIDFWKRKFSAEDEYYSEEIVKRAKFVEQICKDILNKIYI